MKLHRHLAGPAASFFLAPDQGGGTGGNGQTLEQQLSQLRTDLTTAQSSIQSLTRERDQAVSDLTTRTTERDQLQSQFDELTTTANDLRTQLTTVTGERDTARSELSTARNNLTLASANVTRLEKLCGVKGIDQKTAVPSVDQSSAGGHVYDQWNNASGAEKSRLWSAHRDEIRAEGERRAKAGR
jgi:chromosome segregation ATPase